VDMSKFAGVGLAAALLVAILASGSPGSRGQASITSTLAGRTVLPLRIRWLAKPSAPPSRIAKVEFLVDGRIRWREQRPPYTYGGDGNDLVTSWLRPGAHRFAVLATSKDGSRAIATTAARVRRAPPPPAALAGRWQRIVTKEEAKSAVSSAPGRWKLTIDEIGWRFRDPGTHGALVDVVYPSGGILEARSGISTTLPAGGQERNIWCEEPFQPVRYRWTVAADILTLELAGPRRCDGQSNIWVGDWSRRS
jgi:hypothetical protein